MAKATAKAVPAPTKKSAAKPKAKTSVTIETVSEEILAKLKSLDMEQQLQADIEWCLGSYRYDQNASGLIEAITKAHIVLKEAHTNKTKGITATLLSNIEKVIN